MLLTQMHTSSFLVTISENCTLKSVNILLELTLTAFGATSTTAVPRASAETQVILSKGMHRVPFSTAKFLIHICQPLVYYAATSTDLTQS